MISNPHAARRPIHFGFRLWPNAACYTTVFCFSQHFETSGAVGFAILPTDSFASRFPEAADLFNSSFSVHKSKMGHFTSHSVNTRFEVGIRTAIREIPIPCSCCLPLLLPPDPCTSCSACCCLELLLLLCTVPAPCILCPAQDGAKIQYMLAEWDANKLSWADFRGKVLGATDPATAPEGTIRRTILDKCALQSPAPPCRDPFDMHL